MSVITLTVDWEHIGPTRFGGKWLTFRYDDEKSIMYGDTLRLVDPDGECFVLADVKGIFYMTIEEFIRAGFPYYRDYELQEFLEMMNGYYDDPISKHTECKGISYEISCHIGDYLADDEDETEDSSLEDYDDGGDE